MRTTMELPDELFRAAKVRAAERGESLRQLVERAVARELESARVSTGERVALPLIPHHESAPEITMTTNEEFEETLANEDSERYGW